MKRYIGLLRTTWWLWIVLTVMIVPLTLWIDSAFIVLLPVYVVTFLYFAHVRFDENGERITFD